MKDLKYLAAVKSPPGPYNDIEIGADGDIVTVDGVDRIKQDVAKILMTELGLMPYPNYGSSLPLMPGSQQFSSTLLDTISSEVISAVQYLVYVEESALLDEQISSITTLKVSYEDAAVSINLTIANKAKEEASLGLSL